jgi:hypothetical protein
MTFSFVSLQVVTLQQQMYQKMGGMVSVPVAKEGKRMEGTH